MDRFIKDSEMKGANLTVQRFDHSASHEISEDFSLPDYMPEVRKIISCTAQALPENKYLNSGAVDVSGLVIYSVLYVGDDGSITCAPLNSEYAASIGFQDSEGDDFTAADFGTQTCVESTTCRATGPRRLSMSSRMRTRIFSIGKFPVDEKVSAVSYEGSSAATPADLLSMEWRKSEVDCSMAKFLRSTGTASGELREREDTKIISCSGSVGIGEVRGSADGITVRGDVYLTCLILTPDGVYASSRAKAPFEEKMVYDGSDEIPSDAEFFATACARCASVNVSGGENGVFTWEMEYDLEGELQICSSQVVSDDAYSTEYEDETVYGEKEVLSVLRCVNTALSAGSSKQVAGGQDKTVASAFGKASFDRAEVEPSGKITIGGNCTIYAIVVGGGDASVEEITFPIKYECDCKNLDDGTPTVRCDISVLYADARFDGDKLNVNAELSLSVAAMAKKRVRVIEEVRLNKDLPIKTRKNVIKIYYPEDGETRWDIAKRYHAESKNITEGERTNALSRPSPVMIVPETGSVM